MFRWYFYCFSKYLTFKGRASRAEYWSFTLINIVILFCLALLGGDLDALIASGDSYKTLVNPIANQPGLVSTFSILNTLYSLFVIAPVISVTIRRLHDRDHTGWWIWSQFIPILNIVLFIFLILGSQRGPNQYGLRAPATPNDIVPQGYMNPYGYFEMEDPSQQVFNNSNIYQQQPEQQYRSQTQFPKNYQTKSEESIMDEMMKENEKNADVQAGLDPKDKTTSEEPTKKTSTHRPMGAEESGMVAMLKRLSGQK